MPIDASTVSGHAPLWKRLVASSLGNAPGRVPLSFSCVVVPPPVPAAQPRFEAHIASLVQHVHPLLFVTVTSRTPYLPAEEHADVASPPVAGPPNAAASATQLAIAQIVRTVHADETNADAAVMLTLAGTMPASPEATVLTEEGLHGVLHDYLDRTLATKADIADRLPWVSPSRAGFIPMRGADDGFTQRQWQAAHAGTADKNGADTMPARSPYGAYEDGKSLLRAVLAVESEYMANHRFPPSTTADEAPLTLLVPGFPEGHMMHRLWTCTEAEAKDVTVTMHTSVAGSTATNRPLLARAYRYLQDLNATLKNTTVPYHAGGASDISGESLAEAVRKLITRTEAAMALGTVPAYIAETTLEAEVEELVRDKLMPIALATPTTFRTPVVVTQTILDPAVFLSYAARVRRCFREHWMRRSTTATTAPVPISSVDVVVLPGVLSPQRGEDFTRTVLQLCVRTATPAVQSLLRTYKADLTAALQAWESASTAQPALNGKADGDGGTAAAFRAQKEQAECRFLVGMETLTVDLCDQLIQGGYGHVYFSAFAYGCGEALGRVVEQLHAKQTVNQTLCTHRL